MKNSLLFLMIVGFLFSCETNDGVSNLETELIGDWKLIQMTGSLSNSETSGAEMEWQEIYSLNTNGTFQKSRERDGVITEVSGTYRLIRNSTETTIELAFNSESDLVGSCTSNTKETLILQSETIFLNTWSACDGPRLKYEKIN